MFLPARWLISVGTLSFGLSNPFLRTFFGPYFIHFCNIADLQQGHSGWGWEVGEVPPSALFDQLATSVGVTGWLFNNIPVLDPPHFQLSHLGGGSVGVAF